jgi:hypothetical protein
MRMVVKPGIVRRGGDVSARADALRRELNSSTPHVRTDTAAKVPAKLTRELHAVNAGDVRELTDSRPVSRLVDRLADSLKPAGRRSARGGRLSRRRHDIKDDLLDVLA